MARQQLTYFAATRGACAQNAAGSETAHHSEDAKPSGAGTAAGAYADSRARGPYAEASRGIAGCAAPANSRGAATAAADSAGAFPARTGEACAATKSESAEPAIAVRPNLHDQLQEAIQHSNPGGGIQVPNSRSIPGGRAARADPECSRAQRFLLPPKAWIFQAIFSGFWRL